MKKKDINDALDQIIQIATAVRHGVTIKKRQPHNYTNDERIYWVEAIHHYAGCVYTGDYSKKERKRICKIAKMHSKMHKDQVDNQSKS